MNNLSYVLFFTVQGAALVIASLWAGSAFLIAGLLSIVSAALFAVL